MSAPTVDDFLPIPPAWSLDWQGLDEAYDWVRALRGAPHDPVHHQEGDVWVHTRMVLEELAASAEWRSLDEEDRRVAFAAALLHDVAKPATAAVDADGRVSNRGHSRIGALEARAILWRMGFPPALRERACAVVACHQAPFWLIERDPADALRFVAEQSLTCGNRVLACVAEADARGRICADREQVIENVDLFREIARDARCYAAPFPFPDDQTRFQFFSRPGSVADPRWPIPSPPEAPEAILMSGLPAAGKSLWLASHVPDMETVSLDAQRLRLGIRPEKEQGRAVQAAREAAREIMRRGDPFAWDATNFTRSMRRALVSLFAGYGYRVRIVSVEAPAAELMVRNAERAESVPDRAMRAMLRKWEHPVPSEAHAIESAAWTLGAARPRGGSRVVAP